MMFESSTYAIVRPANAPPSSTSAAATPKYAHRLGSSAAFGWSSANGKTGAAYEKGTLAKLPSIRNSILSSGTTAAAERVRDDVMAVWNMVASSHLG